MIAGFDLGERVGWAGEVLDRPECVRSGRRSERVREEGGRIGNDIDEGASANGVRTLDDGLTHSFSNATRGTWIRLVPSGLVHANRISNTPRSVSKDSQTVPFTRRALLRSLGGVSLVPAAGGVSILFDDHTGSLPGAVTGTDPETKRNQPSGLTDRSLTLDARQSAGQTPDGSTSQYLWNGRYPPQELRFMEGDSVSIDVANNLPRGTGTTIHWHGLPVPNEMDGVPGVTQDPIPSGDSMTYEYRASPSGTYLYHSHVDLQMDRSMAGPLVIEEDDPHVDYDHDVVVLVDDYLSDDPPDGEYPSIPDYDGIVMNGALPDSPDSLTVSEGDRVRFRFINGGAAGVFEVNVAGHEMTVAFADGRPVDPVQVDSFWFGSAERYDVIVECDNPGVWDVQARPVNAEDLGNPDSGRFVLQYEAATGPSTAPDPSTNRLDRRDLRALEAYPNVFGSPDRHYTLTLGPGPEPGSWAMGGQLYPDADELAVSPGDHVRVTMRNQSEMFHPMHLHGHFFKVDHAIKDGVLVEPGEQVAFDFYADNPGDWFFHCHNDYHLNSGMARVVSYQS